ncbi:hypothetical protein [Microcoleus anatoxicus]|uniref:Uncharacterized protein n=1 Tax=Microcoleus anatoxicus PTRS2 TaxID=2705321 RepID=A0ABU8YPP2_9CYAN
MEQWNNGRIAVSENDDRACPPNRESIGILAEFRVAFDTAPLKLLPKCY